MKEIQVKIPDYISIGQYQEISKTKGIDPLSQMLKIIVSLSEYTEDEVREWPVSAITQVSAALSDITTAPNEFYPIVEFKDEMYGYAGLSKGSFGEYLDIEGILKDPINNLHHLAAALYRPIVKHKFNSWSFIRRYGFNAADNKVEDPFKWYTVEKYNNEKREERSEMMKDFPVQLILGAMGFMSVTGTLYLNDIPYSGSLSQKTKNLNTEKIMLEALSQSIGGGSALFTVLAKPTSSV